MVRYALIIGSIVLLLLPAGKSYGTDLSGLQPPTPYAVFSTFTAESPEKGHLAVDISYDTLLRSSAYHVGTDMSFGIKDNLEISLSATDARGEFEDLAIGLKHRFIDKGPNGPALAYMLISTIDLGGEDVSTGGSYGGGFIMSERVGPVFAHFNLIYLVPGDSKYKGEFRASGGLVFAAAHNKWLLGEVYGRSTHYSDAVDQCEARLGYRALIAENLYADLGMGVDFLSDPADYRLMLTVAVVLPGEKKNIRRIYEDK